MFLKQENDDSLFEKNSSNDDYKSNNNTKDDNVNDEDNNNKDNHKEGKQEGEGEEDNNIEVFEEIPEWNTRYRNRNKNYDLDACENREYLPVRL